MYIITNKRDNVILGMGERLGYMSNGYPRLLDKNIAFVTEQVNVNEVENVPSEVSVDKYCYTTEKGFYINPGWVEKDPSNIYDIPDEVYAKVIDDYTMKLLEGGVL